MSRPAIRIEDVSKRYQLGVTHTGLSQRMEKLVRSGFRRGKATPEPEREFWALKGVSLDIPEGEAMGLIGPNGAGKSTLLKLLSRITFPTSGRIEMHGRVGSLLEVGTGFHPELTGRENVYLNGAILGFSRRQIQQRFDEIVEFSGIGRFLDTPVKRYSSGMYVRLAFSVSVHLEPEILMIDEVLSVGDHEFQQKCLAKMDDVARSGATIVFVSHSLTSVQRLCSRAAWIEGGVVMDDGPTQSVIRSYLKRGAEEDEKGPAGIAEIPDDARRHGSGELKLRRMVMRNAEGEADDQLRLGAPCSFDLEFEVLEPVPDAVVMLTICAADGSKVVTAVSADDGGSPRRLEPGHHTITVALDEMELLPGEFCVEAGISSPEEDGPYDWIERALEFTALRKPHGDVRPYFWKTSYGFVRPRSEWSFTGPDPVPGPDLSTQPPTEALPGTESRR